MNYSGEFRFNGTGLKTVESNCPVLRPKDAVTARRTLYRRQGDDLKVCAGWRGIVVKVDVDGDALVDFGGEMALRWVRHRQLTCLCREDAGDVLAVSRGQRQSKKSAPGIHPLKDSTWVRAKLSAQHKPDRSLARSLTRDRQTCRCGQTVSRMSSPDRDARSLHTRTHNVRRFWRCANCFVSA